MSQELEQDAYTRLRLLIGETTAELKSALADHHATLRTEIREVAARVEHYERTSEMRFKGVQEGQTRLATDLGDLRASIGDHDRRLGRLERADERSAGKEEGSDRTRQQLTWAVGIITGLLGVLAYLVGAGATP